MASFIPIKIRRTAKPSETEVKNVLNLTPSPENAQKPVIARYLRWLFWALIAAAIGEGVALICFFIVKPPLPFDNLMPPKTALVAYFDQTALKEIVVALSKNQYSWPPFNWAQETTKKFLAKNQLSSLDAISGLFDNKMALAILPKVGPRPAWLIFTTRQASRNDFDALLKQTTQQLKQNFDLADEDYRQTTITKVKELNQSQANLFYVQVQNYFLISSDLNALKETIDRAID